MVLLIHWLLLAVAQPLQPFEIRGTIDQANLKRIYLSAVVADKAYYFATVNDSADIKDHSFLFKGMINHPHPFFLYYTDTVGKVRVISEMLFVQPGIHTVHIDSFAEGMKIVVSNSPVNDEFLNKYIREMKPFGTAWERSFDVIDSVSDAYDGKVPDSIMLELQANEAKKKHELDLFLLDYVKKNPGSYAALWKLIQKFSVLGYDPVFTQVYNAFSPSIRSTSMARVLSKKLGVAALTASGKIFPELSLADIHQQKIKFPGKQGTQRFIFIDFWYSHCAPCIAQFKDLKSIYDRYKENGFLIISISTDKMTARDDWKKAIARYNLDWKHLWDINGKEAARLSINSFPTNFLIDNRGMILEKNLTPSALNKYLKTNLLK